MEELNQNVEQTQQNQVETEKKVENKAEIYVDAINKLKATTVSKTEYDKIKEERDTLAKSVIEGKAYQNDAEKTEEPKRTIQELRTALKSGKLNNQEFITTALELRDRVLEQDGKDIFVAQSSQYAPTSESYEAAEQFANVMKESIEEADGDSEVFRSAYLRRTNDVPVPRRR